MAAAAAAGDGDDVQQRQAAYEEASTSPETLTGMFAPLRAMAIGHLQQFPESWAPLEAFRNFYDNILPSLLDNLSIWYRSRRHKLVGIAKFTGTRYEKPAHLRNAQLAALSSLADSLTFVQRARLLRRSVCMVVMVNLRVTTVRCTTSENGGRGFAAAKKRSTEADEARFHAFIDSIHTQAQERRAAARAAARAARVRTAEAEAKAAEAEAEGGDGGGGGDGDGDGDDDGWAALGDEDFSMGVLSEEQERVLREACNVRHIFSQEVPLFKCPFPLGDEDVDDPERVSPLSRQAGSFIISGKAPQKMHALRRPLRNVPHSQIVRKDGTKRMLRVTGYMQRDDTYGNTFTFHMMTEWNPAAFPTIQVAVSYPRQQTLSLSQFFLLLMVDDVASILQLMWPAGVPRAEVRVHQTIREMLERQHAARVAAGVTTRENLFSRMHFEGLEDYSTNDIHGLHHYDWVKEHTVAQIAPQQGRVPVRDVMLGKALTVAHFAYVTAMTAMGQMPLTDRDAPRMHMEEMLDQLLGLETQRALRKHIQPLLRGLMRNCASTGGEVTGAVLHNKHRQMTGCLFANVFAGRSGGRSSAIGADKRLQASRFSPMDDANATVHMTVTCKGATVGVRALRPSAYMHYGPHTPDGPYLQLTTHRVAASHFWQRGMKRSDVERFVRTLFGRDLLPLVPPQNAADAAFTASTRSVDFWVTPEWQRRAAAHVVGSFAGGAVLVMANHAVLGFVRGTREEVVARALAGRTRGVLPRVCEVLPHRLGVDVCCENGTVRRPLVVLARWRRLRRLFAAHAAGADYDTLTPTQLLQTAWHAGALEYLSGREIFERRLAVADSPYRLKESGRAREAAGVPFTHMDLHPQLMFGILGQTPFLGCVSSVRTVFMAKMLSQVAFRSKAPRDALEQVVSLTHGEEGLVQTLVARARGAARVGQNVVIAFMALASVQDDSLTVQAEFAAAGGFSVRRRQTYTVLDGQRWRVVGRNTWENFHNIELVRRGDRSKLDPHGVIRVGEVVVPHETVLIQRVCRKTVGAKSAQRKILEDASIMHTRSSSADERWRVAEVNYLSRGFVQVVLTRNQPLEVGDKLTDMYGQKATVGCLMPRARMPRFASGPMKGVTPTVIAHPACLTRMTVGSLLAMLTGVAAAQRGEVIDATFGEPFDVEAVRRDCVAAGLDAHGRAYMEDPDSGELLQEVALQPDGSLAYYPLPVSVGLVTMVRVIKHTPASVTAVCGAKVARSATTGQPLRSARRHHHQGAPIRFGVMPQHATCMHGAAYVLQDAVHRGGMTTERVCADCHLPVSNPPYDLVNMVRASLVRTAVAMRALFKASGTCPHCGGSRVVRVNTTAMLRLLSNILHGANTRLEYFVQAPDEGDVATVAAKSRLRAQRRLLRDLDAEAQGLAARSTLMNTSPPQQARRRGGAGEEAAAGRGVAAASASDSSDSSDSSDDEDAAPAADAATGPRLTMNVLSMYEQANVVGVRAEQLEHGAEPLLDLKEMPPQAGVVTALHIAREELRRGLLHFNIRRYFPDGSFEDCPIQHMRLAHV